MFHGMKTSIPLIIATLAALSCDDDRRRHPVVPPVEARGEERHVPDEVKQRNDANTSGIGAKVLRVRVITHDGVTTLRGQVHSERERRTISSLAQGLGADRIDIEIEVVRDENPTNKAATEELRP